MIIREAKSEDVPHIVSLLKKSLGESLMPKSEQYWIWKHIRNPFGVSPVLVAEENNTLIGVRAFMCWQWTRQGKILRAIRAVDTATHPDHQGKGIFKKLTLKLVDTCKNDGVDFVFNSPNSQSKPGYLKMGWEEAGKLPVSIQVRKPLSMLYNVVMSRQASEPELKTQLSELLFHPGLQTLLANTQPQNISTLYSPAYLQWRYLQVPVVKYGAVGIHDKDELRGLLIYRFKPSKAGIELRITDIFARAETDFKALISKLTRECPQAEFITLSGAGLQKLGMITMNIGPVVTVRNLNLTSTEELAHFHKWSPSLGDLELF
jgi:N-acetylglutamate synthase-like GNAT family acetyltransferase